MHQTGITFRVFISSTFGDLKAERNALQADVFPILSALCMEYGCRFQAIDLRWGVTEEASHEQQTINICLNEIKRCQKITPRPNFIVLLGERYGWLPLPGQIPASEMETLLKVPDFDKARIIWEEKQPDGAKGWYRLDRNARPHEYCLQPRTGVYTDRSVWGKVEVELHKILLNAARQAGITGKPIEKYERSATEQEIIEGAYRAETDHAFCYFRTIKDIPIVTLQPSDSTMSGRSGNFPVSK